MRGVDSEVVPLMTRIGTSDLDVLPLSLGGNVFGWTADRDTSFAVLDAFVDGGGDFIDTADSYSSWVPGNEGGESETIVGEWLASRRPAGVVVATKVSQHPKFRGLAASNVRKAAEASLARLGVDEIDLYYAHFDDETVPLEETVAAFGQLVDDGLVRHIAVSNYSADRIREWIEIARRTVPRCRSLCSRITTSCTATRSRTRSSRSPRSSGSVSSRTTHWRAASSPASTARRMPKGRARRGPTARRSTRRRRGLRVIDALQEIGDVHDASIAATSLAWLPRAADGRCTDRERAQRGPGPRSPRRCPPRALGRRGAAAQPGLGVDSGRT